MLWYYNVDSFLVKVQSFQGTCLQMSTLDMIDPNGSVPCDLYSVYYLNKTKVIPLQARCGPDGG